jgi:hypothetical protein
LVRVEDRAAQTRVLTDDGTVGKLGRGLTVGRAIGQRGLPLFQHHWTILAACRDRARLVRQSPLLR